MAQCPVFDRASFAQRLSDALESRRPHLSRRKVAELSGLSRTTLTAWLDEERSPNLDSLYAIADTLGYSAEWLLFGAAPASGSTPAEAELTRVREALKELATAAASLAEDRPKASA